MDKIYHSIMRNYFQSVNNPWGKETHGGIRDKYFSEEGSGKGVGKEK